MLNNYSKAAEMIKNSKYTVILTGAGLSTESGIPDFRSPETGLWEKIDPMKALSVDVLMNSPREFYNTGFSIILSMIDAKPNKAHYYIKELEDMGLIQTLVTQNIDNLHYEAGSKNVYEVHGQSRTCSCMKCKKKYEISDIEKLIISDCIPPICSCGGVIRPDVILFGDMLPDCFYDAVESVKNADLLIVLGSSLSVSPVNYMAQICKRLMIINLGKTSYDERAELIINEKASLALENILEHLR